MVVILIDVMKIYSICPLEDQMLYALKLIFKFNIMLEVFILFNLMFIFMKNFIAVKIFQVKIKY